uniref:NADH-ubiquinone oxidoreductase chain 6 n=1 Tax=Hydrophilidae sp. BMNH 1274335 TaxID=1796515 RepID=A0A126TFN3_9COLE|nr:NADH dehydrogenase subunit 6 [Hydrophilidae sp. BMNH 1274335]
MLCMIFIMYMSLMTSMFILFSTHPMTMGLTLLIQVICVSLMTGMLSNNFWFSYILFIIMIGGMMVLFIYMTSIASNEKFKFSKMLMIKMLMLFLLFSFISMLSDNIINEYQNLFYFMDMNINLNKYINYPYNIITIMMILYLLITLIAIVKISKIKYGPLRTTN